MSEDAIALTSRFPITESGSLYFFNPSKQLMPEIQENNPLDEEDYDAAAIRINNKNLEFALTEIFNFYARRYSEKHTDFE